MKPLRHFMIYDMHIHVRIYLILVGCCRCMLDVVIVIGRAGALARCALNNL